MHPGKILRAALAAALIALATPALGQWKVFDATNFIKQAVTAAQTGASAESLMRQYQLQIEQYLIQVANQQSTPQALLDSALSREISAAAYGQTDRDALIAAGIQVRNVYASSANTAANGTRLYQQAANFGQDMNRFSAASGMGWDEILRYEKNRNVATHEIATDHYRQAENLVRQLQSWQEEADRATRNAGTAQGAKDALGSIALQNKTVIDQLSGLTASATRKEFRETVEFSKKAESDEELRKIRENARKSEQLFIEVNR